MSHDHAFAVVEAARRVSDKRTSMDDGFWVSKREMRYLDNALADFDESLPTAADVRGILATREDDPDVQEVVVAVDKEL